jgi:acetyltransferase-like isoleucine patch superfamily enzyme
MKPLAVVAGAFATVRDALRKASYRAQGVRIGRSTYISPKAYLDTHKPGRIVVGENCYITRNVVILCHTDTKRGGPRGLWAEAGGAREYGDVVIGNNVFIGVNSVVMPGVTIGDDAIIGALTLVDRDIPPGKVAVGIPARIVGATADHLRGEP